MRAVALIGVVVMNYHGYMILAGGERGDGAWDDFFDPWRGPLSTRFAATFVLTAGVGVTLLTRSATAPAVHQARRRTLLRRGLVLFVLGWFVDEHWPGTILPYYGALFMLSAFLFRLRSAVVLAIGAAAAAAGALIAWWALEQRLDGHDPTWLFAPRRYSPRGLVFDTFVNGTHPLLPWLAFLCAGIVLGRVLRTDWWRTACFGVGPHAVRARRRCSPTWPATASGRSCWPAPTRSTGACSTSPAPSARPSSPSPPSRGWPTASSGRGRSRRSATPAP